MTASESQQEIYARLTDPSILLHLQVLGLYSRFLSGPWMQKFYGDRKRHFDAEELEVLKSIYDGDEAFKQMSDTVFHYKYGEDGSQKSFIVEISWPSNYPEELPIISMELFYNKHVLPQVKEAVKSALLQQASDLLGMSMTFSLFEWVKDNLETFLSDQPETPVALSTCVPLEEEAVDDVLGKKEKKEQLTKSQKRRIFDRFGATTDRPRGWNWVDVVKHLSQTGGQKIES